MAFYPIYSVVETLSFSVGDYGKYPCRAGNGQWNSFTMYMILFCLVFVWHFGSTRHEPVAARSELRKPCVRVRVCWSSLQSNKLCHDCVRESSHLGLVSSWYEILSWFCCSNFTIPIIQSGHNFVHVTTAQLSCHVQNYDLIRPWLFK